MRSEGMTDGENYRDLLTRLSTALAMTEAAYLEARRRRDLPSALALREPVWIKHYPNEATNAIPQTFELVVFSS